MKRLLAFLRSRYPWAIAAGLLLAAAFPKIGIAGLAWVAPGFILITAIGQPPGRAFRIGYVAGLAHYLASLYWLLLIPVNWAPILGWAALSAYLALFPAVWVWLCWRLFPADLTGTSFTNLAGLTRRFLSVPWSQRFVWTLTCAAIWVALEMTIARLFSGFPWNFLGASQYKLLPLIQFASFTGIYGVSFLVVWTSLCFLCVAMVTLRRPAMRSAWVGEIILPMLTIAALYGSGYFKLMRPEPKRPELTVALIQPSIPQTMIWDPTGTMDRFHQLIQLSEDALTNHPDLLIWPEAAVPGLVRYQKEIGEPILNLAHEHKVWMIIGGDDAEPRPNAQTLEDADYFNSSFLIAPDGSIAGRYKKRNLVAFGEYVPLVRYLPFIKYLTPIDGGFTPGDRAVPFNLKDLGVRVSVLICFEDIFPQLVREYVSGDTDFLVNLTNNGWFGEGAAQWQHAASAVFRAVENGVPLVRCSNNGLTCWVDPGGRVQYFRDATDAIYGPGFMIAHIPLLNPGETRAPTYYRLYGDRFGWLCVVVTLFQFSRNLARRRLTRRHIPQDVIPGP